MWQLLTFFFQNMVIFQKKSQKNLCKAINLSFCHQVAKNFTKTNIIYYNGIQYEKNLCDLIKSKQGFSVIPFKTLI